MLTDRQTTNTHSQLHNKCILMNTHFLNWFQNVSGLWHYADSFSASDLQFEKKKVLLLFYTALNYNPFLPAFLFSVSSFNNYFKNVNNPVVTCLTTKDKFQNVLVFIFCLLFCENSLVWPEERTENTLFSHKFESGVLSPISTLRFFNTCELFI